MSLYSRLYKYRARPERKPLEAFLTEALGDLLDRLPRRKKIDFCEQFLLAHAEPTEISRWQSLIARFEMDEMRWITQRPLFVPGLGLKYVDLALQAGKIPLLAIEIKITAGFGGDIQRLGDSTDFELSQLEYYGLGLATEAMTNDVALILLTHNTEPPIDFLKYGEKYRANTRAVQRWSALHKWLKDGREWWNEATPPSQLLVDAFQDFLTEHSMTQESPSLVDFAAARLLAHDGGWQRITSAFGTVKDIAREAFPSLRKNINSPWEMHTSEKGSDGVVWDWIGKDDVVEVVWGVWFGTAESELFPVEPSLSVRTAGFIYIATPEVCTRIEGYESWHFPSTKKADKTHICKMIALDTLCGDPRGFTDAFVDFLRPALEEARHLFLDLGHEV